MLNTSIFLVSKSTKSLRSIGFQCRMKLSVIINRKSVNVLQSRHFHNTVIAKCDKMPLKEIQDDNVGRVDPKLIDRLKSMRESTSKKIVEVIVDFVIIFMVVFVVAIAAIFLLSFIMVFMEAFFNYNPIICVATTVALITAIICTF